MIHYTRNSLQLMKKIMDVQEELDLIQVIILLILSFIQFYEIHVTNILH